MVSDLFMALIQGQTNDSAIYLMKRHKLIPTIANVLLDTFNYLSGVNLYTLADKDTIEMKDNLNLIYKKSDYLT